MKIIIWGLRNKRHSHRYIHQGFYETFQRLGYDAIWVDDSPKNSTAITDNSVIFSADISNAFLPVSRKAKYVLHNNKRDEFKSLSNVLNLQVYTKKATGESLGHPLILYSSESRTLFQPWGIAEPIDSWKPKAEMRGNTEYWVGAVWNNSLNQGNKVQIREYQKALKKHDIKFRRVGGTRWFTKEGISPSRSLELVSRSPVGAAIVGQWQKEVGYVPCRLFKNVAAGHVPVSNADYTSLFPSVGIFRNSIEKLVNESLSLTTQISNVTISEAQENLKNFTYVNAIKRIQSLI